MRHAQFQPLPGRHHGFVGRRLPALLHAVGVQNIRTKVTVETPPLGDYRRTHRISLIDSVRDKIIDKRLLKGAELSEHREALMHHLNDPATTVIDKLLVQCWGQKSR